MTKGIMKFDTLDVWRVMLVHDNYTLGDLVALWTTTPISKICPAETLGSMQSPLDVMQPIRNQFRTPEPIRE